ncbi:MAG: BON domain-containing protein [Pseudomonadota bacterium]|nr:BON domain-containing protein [Pseudomonadota bacterium]
MTTSKFVKALLIPGVLSTACLLAAFAPIPVPTNPDLSTQVAMTQDSDVDNAHVDNSRVNQRDRSAQEPTADQAGNQLSDRDVMQKIRQAIIADKSLSTYGHNVKVISQNGKVTLKGPVNSDQEKASIEAKAVDVVGDGNVVNNLSVKTN